MKKRIDVIAGETAYQNLSSFTEIEKLNKTVRAYRDVIRTSIKRTDVQTRLIALLEILKRHSCKQIGVSYLCKNTIAAKMEVSYKTVQRLMKKLQDMGMIRQVPTKRKKDMKQTANAVIIVPVKEVSDKTPSKVDEKCPTIKTSAISKTNNKNIRNVGDSAASRKSVDNPVGNTIDFYDYSYVSSNVPSKFIDSVRPFFTDASSIYRLWSRLKLAAKKSKLDAHDHLDSFVKSFKEAILNIKQQRNNGDEIGYIYGTWRKIAAEKARQLNNSVPNWLEA
ncbi:MAG: helix-turn-helix domain-containing protein [Bacillus sp. (in: firmicutes)]